MSQTELRPTNRPTNRPTTRPALPRARYPRGAAAPVLVEVRRGTIVESRHRGHIVQVNARGEVQWGIGDPDVLVTLRSAVKPFGVAALVDGGGVEAYNLTEQELAVMAASHTGEDAHVRTLQAVFRRAGISQSLLACGSEGAPLDSLTRARLARDGETPGPIRHMCSGFHSSSLLLSRLKGWSLPDYWRPEHPSQVADPRRGGTHLRHQASRPSSRPSTRAACRPTPSHWQRSRAASASWPTPTRPPRPARKPSPRR